MTTIQVCRICLSHDTRMYTMADMPLQTFYEQITNKPFNGDGRPSTVCYICYYLLKKCCRFSESAIKADELLQQIYDSGIQITEQNVSMTHKPCLFMALKSTPVTRLNVAKDMSKNESEVKSEKSQDPLDVEGIEYEQEGMNDIASEVPKQNTPTHFDIQEESKLCMDMHGTEDDGLCSEDTLQSQDLHHSSDLDDDGNDKPLESVKLEENDEAPEKEISEKAVEVNEETVDAEFREIILTKEEQIDQILEKTKSPYYLRMRHKCELCCKGFPNLRTFGLHKKKHSESSGAFECDMCHVRWRSAAQLTAHANSCHSSKRYACNHCERRSRTVAQARKHFISEHGASEEPALDCQAPFGAPVPKKRKLDQSTKVPERTEVRWYFRSLAIEDNAKNPKKNEIYTEGINNKVPVVFTLKNTSNQDSETSQNNIFRVRKRRTKRKKSFTCQYCGKTLKFKHKLIEHLRGHTGEKPFTCNHCGRKFRRKTRLIYHTRIHTGERPFTCNYCDKKFRIKTTLTQHLRIHTGERPFACNYCDRKFSVGYQLKNHVKIHTGEEPFTCNYCGKKFVFKQTLSRHLMIHTGEKPFECNYCKRNFAAKFNLNRHMKSRSHVTIAIKHLHKKII